MWNECFELRYCCSSGAFSWIICECLEFVGLVDRRVYSSSRLFSPTGLPGFRDLPLASVQMVTLTFDMASYSYSTTAYLTCYSSQALE